MESIQSGPRLRARLPALLLALAALVPWPAPALSQDGALAGLDEYVREAMADWRIPGLAIAVVQDDSVIFARGYGERAAGSGDPVDEHTLFAIASTTKAFTAGVLGTLVDEGVLHWDDRVEEHLPWFDLGDPYVSQHITIRDLLTHRTGLAREDNVWIAAPVDRAEMLRRVRHLEQEDGFREGYGYNNLMYMVAGEVAAAAAGTPWAELVDRRLFEPLGMRRTTARFDTVQTRENVTESHVRRNGRIVRMDRRDYDALGPAGSVFSSAWEMAQWVRMHLNGGTYEGRRLLADSTVREMHTPQLVIRMDSVDQRMFPTRNFFAYGLGWRLHDHHGRKVVQHTGSVNYTRTQVGMIPSEGIGVVVLSNLSSSALQTALMYRVFDLLLGLPLRDWSGDYLALQARSDARSDERAREREAERVQGTRPSLPLEEYAGTYSDPLYGDVEVTLEDGGLVLRYAPEYVADLRHWHHDTFRGDWRSTGFGETFVTFQLDARGRARALELPGFATFRR